MHEAATRAQRHDQQAETLPNGASIGRYPCPPNHRLLEVNAQSAPNLPGRPQSRGSVMPGQFRVVFHNMAVPFGADDLVRDNALELERLLGQNIACSVVIERAPSAS